MAVDGVELGRKMFNNELTDVAALLAKPNESEEVKEIKKLITDMLACDPDKRPRIGEVVDRLSQLFHTVGSDCLKQATDTLSVTDINEHDVTQAAGTLSLSTSVAAMSCADISKESVVGRDVTEKTGDIEGNTKDTNDKLMAVDVFHSKAVWVLEVGKWGKLCGLPNECLECCCISLVCDHLVFVCKHVTLSFSLSTKQWKRLKQMPTSRSSSSAVVLNEKLFVMGRSFEWNILNVCEILHVKHNLWSSAPSLPVPIGKPLLAALLSRIYILPQRRQLSSKRTHLLVYDPLSFTYEYRAKLPGNIDSTLGACLVGVTDMLYLLGGDEGLAWQYNPNTNLWIQLVTPTARYDWHRGCCPVVTDDNILLCGGGTEGGCPWSMIEEYSTKTQQWKVLDIHLPFEYGHHWSSAFNARM